MPKMMCPVCGYKGLTSPPRDYNICPCCGTEFGYDDFGLSHEELRSRWLRRGANWFSQVTQPPPDWNLYEQLFQAGYGFDISNDFVSDTYGEVQAA
jgi:hypothetical protein